MIPDRNSEIAERAYRIWEREGRPQGKALDHWLKAEAELTTKPAVRTAPPGLGTLIPKPQAPKPLMSMPKSAGRKKT